MYLELASLVDSTSTQLSAATAFKKLLSSFETWFDRHPTPQPLRAIIGGALVGGIVVWLPAVAGNGYEPLDAMLDAPTIARAVGVLPVAKVIATSGSVHRACRVGIATPMLFVGAALGTSWARLIGSPARAGSYMLVGMAATRLSACTPLTLR